MKDFLFTFINKELTRSQLTKNGKTNLILFYNTYYLGCSERTIPFAFVLSPQFPELNLIVIHINFENQPFSKVEVIDVFSSKSSPFKIHVDLHQKVCDHLKTEWTPHWIVLDKELEIYRRIFGSQ